MSINLLCRFVETLRTMAKIDLASAADDHPLLLGSAAVGSKDVRMFYAPFDHVNESARIAIVA